MNKVWLWLSSLCCLASTLCGCADSCVTKTGNPSDSCSDTPGLPSGPSLAELAKECGIDADCEAGGLADGNASISGVPSFDSYFQTVLGFRSRADALTASLEARLDAIGGAFGIAAGADLAAELQARIAASVDGPLVIRVGRPRCMVDARAMAQASARCSIEASPGSATVGCAGSCELPRDAEITCEAGADLTCTFASANATCGGACAGICVVDLPGTTCDGTCRGTCAGTCSLFADAQATQCAGRCDGMCEGSCERDLATPAACEGSCSGECTIEGPSGGCDGAIRALCVARGDAAIDCAGRCEGEFEPPQATAECEQVTRAQARMNLECTPPRVAVDYRLDAGLSPEAAAQFNAGMNVLAARLPTLLSTIARAEAMTQAGTQLIDIDGVKNALHDAFDAAGKGDLRVLFGLNCAVDEIEAVPEAIAPAASRLSSAVRDAIDLERSLGLP